ARDDNCDDQLRFGRDRGPRACCSGSTGSGCSCTGHRGYLAAEHARCRTSLPGRLRSALTPVLKEKFEWEAFIERASHSVPRSLLVLRYRNADFILFGNPAPSPPG